MKKILAILATVGAMAACNNSGSDKTTTDSTTMTDTSSRMTPAPDTSMNNMATDTTHKMSTDTSKMMDTSKHTSKKKKK
jgi:hypothetical protein